MRYVEARRRLVDWLRRQLIGPAGEGRLGTSPLDRYPTGGLHPVDPPVSGIDPASTGGGGGSKPALLDDEEPEAHWWITEHDPPERRPAMYSYRPPGREPSQDEKVGTTIELPSAK